MHTKNFSYDELACPCCFQNEMDGGFLRALQSIRDSLARPFVLNSAYRCFHHNLAVGGNISSRHLHGMAVDISTKGWSSEDLHYLIFEMTSYCDEISFYYTGIGIYKNHIHFDLRPDNESLWVNL